RRAAADQLIPVVETAGGHLTDRTPLEEIGGAGEDDGAAAGGSPGQLDAVGALKAEIEAVEALGKEHTVAGIAAAGDAEKVEGEKIIGDRESEAAALLHVHGEHHIIAAFEGGDAHVVAVIDALLDLFEAAEADFGGGEGEMDTVPA